MLYCTVLSISRRSLIMCSCLHVPTDVPELDAALFIEGLQQEAQRALREVVQPPRLGDHHGRFARILLAASALQTVTPTLLTELFFRPLIGQADVAELLVDMLLCR